VAGTDPRLAHPHHPAPRGALRLQAPPAALLRPLPAAQAATPAAACLHACPHRRLCAAHQPRRGKYNPPPPHPHVFIPLPSSFWKPRLHLGIRSSRNTAVEVFQKIHCLGERSSHRTVAEGFLKNSQSGCLEMATGIKCYNLLEQLPPPSGSAHASVIATCVGTPKYSLIVSVSTEGALKKHCHPCCRGLTKGTKRGRHCPWGATTSCWRRATCAWRRRPLKRAAAWSGQGMWWECWAACAAF